MAVLKVPAHVIRLSTSKFAIRLPLPLQGSFWALINSECGLITDYKKSNAKRHIIIPLIPGGFIPKLPFEIKMLSKEKLEK